MAGSWSKDVADRMRKKQRKCSDLQVLIALALSLLLVHFPVSGGNPSLGKVVPGAGICLVNGTELKLETTLYSGDRVVTEEDSSALFQFPQGDKVHLGPGSSVAVNPAGEVLVLNLERGMALAHSGKGQEIAVAAGGLVVRPEGEATYIVAVQDDGVLVSSRRGKVKVQGIERAYVVPEGKAMRFEPVASPLRPVGAGRENHLTPAAKAGIAIAVAAGITAAIAIPLALNDDQVSPSIP